MTATPRRVAGGESVTLTWGVTQGAAEFHDWLGLFSETDEKKCLRHSYAKGCHRGGTWVVEAPPDGGRCVLPSFPSLSQPPALLRCFNHTDRSSLLLKSAITIGIFGLFKFERTFC